MTSSTRRWALAVAGLLLLTTNIDCLHAATLTANIDFGVAGTVISNGVRGQNPSRGNGWRTSDLSVCYNTSLRGIPAGGLDSDTYDWRNNRSGMAPFVPHPTTLDVLREMRDRKSWGVFTANVRGFGRAWYNNGWKWQYNYSWSSPSYRIEEVPRLGTIARQWLRYTNHILQNYRLNSSGQIVDLSGSPVNLIGDDAVIYNAINWVDSQEKPVTKLLNYGEPPVPKITYWEIGNEPEVIGDNDLVNQPAGHRLPPDHYSYNYRYIRGQLLEEDIRINGAKTIKTGPNICTPVLQDCRDYVDRIRNDGGVMEFLTYHPYYMITKEGYDAGDIFRMEHGLRGLKVFLDAAESWADNYLNATCTSLMMTEHNPGGGPGEPPGLQATMAQALGVVESVFCSANAGLLAAHYWNCPSSTTAQLRAWEMLQSELGDRLVYSNIDDTNFFRLYATKSIQSNRICIWALNFSDTLNRQVNLSLLNVPAGGSIKLMKLGNMGGDTSLMSTSNIGWSTTNLSGQIDPGRFSLTFEDATVSVLVIEPPSTKPAQPDVTGLLTRVWGSVSYIDSVDRFLYLDDGSGVYDGNPGGYKGVRISWELAADLPLVLPVVGQSVSAAGIASRIQYGSGAGRVVLLRTGRELVIH